MKSGQRVISVGDENITLGAYTIEVTHPDKMMYPEDGIAKRDVIEYYRRISDVMLPHMKGRLVIMHRFPDGIDGKDFYHKEVPDYFPEWIKTRTIKLSEGGRQTLMVVEKTADLVYLANQACLVPHIWLSTENKVHHPNKIVFDLDPAGEGFDTVTMAAFMVRDIFAEEGLKPFVMTTGSAGLHVVIPIKPTHDFDKVREYVRKRAQVLADREPQKLTLETHKEKRRGRIFLDYLRNACGQTSVVPYALRALRGAPVATPLDWDELHDSDLTPRSYTLSSIFRRLGNKEDPWKGMARNARTLNV